MEPPIGYGSTHRSIFPESQFRTDGGSVFQGSQSGKKKDDRCFCSSWRDRGARRLRVRDRNKVRMTKTLRVIEDGNHLRNYPVNREFLGLWHRKCHILRVSRTEQIHRLGYFGWIGDWLRLGCH
jgi:hypothetical protein